MKRFSFTLILVTSLLGLTTAIPFPSVPVDDTIYLQKGEKYEIDTEMVWTDYPRLIISGSGATVHIDPKMEGKTVFFMTGEKWIWESVNIRATNVSNVLSMNVEGKKGFLQIRGCFWATESEVDLQVNGRLEHFVLQNNLFANKRDNPAFIDFSDTVGKLVWKNNQWNGNYSMFKTLPSTKRDFERNRFPKANVHSDFLYGGSFYHPEDDSWCIPPEQHTQVNDTFVACLNGWFLEALKMQNDPLSTMKKIAYNPVKSAIEDYELPTAWTFQGKHDIDFQGNEWGPSMLTVFANANVTLSGLEAGWNHLHIQILGMKNSTLIFRNLNLQGPDKMINIGALTDTSHVFFEMCNIQDVEILGTGLGHVHMQDSVLKDFLLSAPAVWGSGNVMKNGRVVTQPYVGHLQYSQLRDTDYHISPFYLGTEPSYRMKFVRNSWHGKSDLIVSHSMTKSIRMNEDVVESEKLAMKIAFSPKVIARGLKNVDKKPLMGAPTPGHVWAKGEQAQKCPDGFHPSFPDSMNIPTRCAPCQNPLRSRDGECDNIREIDAYTIYELPREKVMMGYSPTSDYTPEVAYSKMIAGGEMREECLTCTATCLGLEREDLNRTLFTFDQWMRRNHTEYCDGCALWCMRVAKCENYCLTFISFTTGAIIALLLVGGPFFLFASICLRAKTVRVKVRDDNDKYCKNCGEGNRRNAKFCTFCGQDQSSFLQPEIIAANRDIRPRDEE